MKVSVVLSEDDKEHPIPTILRPAFESIAAAFAAGDFRLKSVKLPEVVPIESDLAADFAANVSDYGEQLITLHPEVWDRACYSFQRTHWDAIIDLSTRNEQVSDLAMHARIRTTPDLQIEIWSIHVP